MTTVHHLVHFPAASRSTQRSSHDPRTESLPTQGRSTYTVHHGPPAQAPRSMDPLYRGVQDRARVRGLDA